MVIGCTEWEGVGEGESEVLSHLISLDTRHPGSLKETLSAHQNRGPVSDPAHVYAGCTSSIHTRKHKTKENLFQDLVVWLLQRMGKTRMRRTSEG